MSDTLARSEEEKPRPHSRQISAAHPVFVTGEMADKMAKGNRHKTQQKHPSSRSSKKLKPSSSEEQAPADHATQREVDDLNNESDVVMDESPNLLDDGKYSSEYFPKEPTTLDDYEIHEPESQGFLRFTSKIFSTSDKTEVISKPQRKKEHRRPENDISKRQLEKNDALLHQLSKAEQSQHDKLIEQDKTIRQLSDEYKQLERLLNQTKEELKNANKKIVENEVLISKAHTTLVSRLANDVSCEFPDDMVRRELQAFFQGDFLSWCADLSVADISEPDQAEKVLREAGVINKSKSYDNTPKELRLDMRLHDGVASLALLQAALSHTLCDLYLSGPYFLAAGNGEAALADTSGIQTTHGLADLDKAFAEVRLDAAIDWRIKTVELLELTRPLTRESARGSAMKFTDNYGYLFNTDDEAVEDLVGLFERFAMIASKLWKRKSTISVFSKPHQFAKYGFHWKSDKMESEADSLPSLGRQLQGHPIGLLTRPLIMANPIAGPEREVVWMKAVVWVSIGQQDMGIWP